VRMLGRGYLLPALLIGACLLGMVSTRALSSRHPEAAQAVLQAGDSGYAPEDILGWADGEPILRAGTFSVPSIYRATHVAPDSPRLNTSAATTMLSEEPVLGIAINGEARAYSKWFMNAREIIHDTVGGRALLVTW